MDEEQHAFGGIMFARVGTIEPDTTEDGEVRPYMPQARFQNTNGLPLNKYGHGPFCRFRVARGWREPGVYVLTSRGTPVYVGEAQNLEDRYGPNGYGNISPRNCFKGGQETNCRLNALILAETVAGAQLVLWFRPVDGGKAVRTAIEAALISMLRPSWNR